MNIVRSNPSRLFRCAEFLLVAALLVGGALRANAQAPAAPTEKTPEILYQMNDSFQSLVKRVSPAVVEVLVTGFGSPDEEDDEGSAPSSIGRERSLGSGVIVDPDGYIVTNYHVVKGADRVRVVLTPAPSQDSQAVSLLKSRGRTLTAHIVGFSKLIDLAVLKVDATGLPTLPLGRYDRVQKGQIVLAFGSPEGLENSVTFGLVSSVLRQPDPDDPMVYIQTDAAINPGNSGGPLVDVDGNVVGIDTFIYTKSGGNEGIGFAIPSGIVRYAYEQIRQYGRVRRRSIGADVQTVTSDLSQGLGLATESGVIVSDVYPGSPAEHAGLKVQDVITTLDGFPVDNVPIFTLALYLLNKSDTAQLEIMRGDKKLGLQLPIYEPHNDPSRLSDLGDPKKDLIPRLGIVGVSVTPDISDVLGGLRIPGGVLVTSIVANRLAVDSGLQEGDVVHSLNRAQIKGMDDLRAAFAKLQPGDPAAMLVERSGKLTYVTFEME
ncbi:MAG TPA: trypsin-like peptidase domain-containing protein [Candidatus Eisenbacteria bacterium]|nr:trypsin-like peptidase domain-containing protein [Candidatus Eisenbacteria bacterium]